MAAVRQQLDRLEGALLAIQGSVDAIARRLDGEEREGAAAQPPASA